MGNEDYYNGLLGGDRRADGGGVPRDAPGAVQTIESPQLRSALFATSHNHRDGDRVVRPFEIDGEQRGLGPLHQLFPTADGWIMVAAAHDGAAVAAPVGAGP